MDRLATENLVEEWSELSTSSLAPGARLGRYELLIPVAYGGMAKVWAARQHGHRGFQKTVAIKTILPHLAHDPEFERMFLDEARIAAGVHHPNVTEIYELGEEGYVLYIAMEWVNGDSLVHVLKGLSGHRQAIELRLGARIVAEACAGLHAAHELTDDDGKLLGVVHRDVSPHNILVSLEGTVKVTDFGVVKAYGQTHETTTGDVKGKAAYLAPEMMGSGTFDRRADIFAMGCVLYEATTGVQPFRGENDAQVMQAVLRGTYDPPAKIVRGYPQELASIIERALAPEPRMRFATAERMRVALEEWLAKTGSVVTATQVGSLVRQRLGPALDKRREQVKSAVAMLQGSDSARMSVQPASGPDSKQTPSRPQSASTRKSHSGIVPTGLVPPLPAPMRDRIGSVPQLPSPTYAPAIAGPRQSGGLPVLPTTAAAPSGAKYAVAAIVGIAFALLVGGLAIALWVAMRPHTEAAIVVPDLATRVAPPPPTVSSAAGAEQAHAPAPVPSTLDVTDLPTAMPTWTAPPSPPAPARSGPATLATAPAKPVALPANPY